jgi:superfamily II DNA or RNA helicase
LKRSRIDYDDTKVLDLIPSPNFSTQKNNQSRLSLRDYQRKALDSWAKADKRGSIVLPTGAGKTVIGVKAIEIVNSATIVIVPTIDLMDQWSSVLLKYFPKIKIGNLGGGSSAIESITVSTYDSAYLRASSLGNRFSLIIFDELHHLAAPGYRSIAEQFASPFRLGLTATIEREDNLDRDLPRLIGGGIVFRTRTLDLARDRHLSPFEIERREVEMLPEEAIEYHKSIQAYQLSLKKLGIRMNYAGSFRRLIMMSGKNDIAREAIRTRNKAMDIALNSEAKIEELRKILSENVGTKTIIFTQHNKLVYSISNLFLIPFITHKSDRDERLDVLNGFKEGRYKVLVTSKVLDEGVDVPDAELGIILSGTGSSREFIQRLGRILRPKADSTRKAKLIEVISAGTREMEISHKRKRAFLNSEV